MARAPSSPESVTLSIRVKPRASKSRILGMKEGQLEVAIAAPPVDGAANEELLRTLSSHFHLPRSRVELVGGATGRQKLVRLVGLRHSDVEAVLKGIG